ncbi:MAG: hypothetical protein K1060chlam5_01161 [Candidatus Anoxychlamydiales bacterium]|nr:hypothetical protein [Candidatus Anoxychlamydiales bacterium]
MNYFQKFKPYLLACLIFSMGMLSPICLQAEKPYFYRALPKSGTHLIMKTLYLLTGKAHYVAHFTKYVNTVDYLIEIHPSERTIIHIRDLRDFFVSHMENIDRGVYNVIYKGGGFHKPVDTCWHIYANWLILSVEEKLTALITLQDELLPYPADCIRHNIITADDLMNRKDVLVTKFENLIGEKGGGTRELQKNEIIKIANFIDVKVTDEKIESICDNLWGLSDDQRYNRTFNIGEIGRWKEYFTEKNIVEFKDKWSSYLIKWGYEVE